MNPVFQVEPNCSLGWVTIPYDGEIPLTAVSDACVPHEPGSCFVSWIRRDGVWRIDSFYVLDDPEYDYFSFYMSNQRYLDYYYQEYGFHKDKTVNILVVI